MHVQQLTIYFDNDGNVSGMAATSVERGTVTFDDGREEIYDRPINQNLQLQDIEYPQILESARVNFLADCIRRDQAEAARQVSLAQEKADAAQAEAERLAAIVPAVDRAGEGLVDEADAGS